MPTQVQVHRKREAIKAYEVRPLTDVRIVYVMFRVSSTDSVRRLMSHPLLRAEKPSTTQMVRVFINVSPKAVVSDKSTIQPVHGETKPRRINSD